MTPKQADIIRTGKIFEHHGMVTMSDGTIRRGPVWSFAGQKFIVCENLSIPVKYDLGRWVLDQTTNPTKG